MRYPASEKLEIIRPVEESALPVRRTLEKIGIPRATFYRWYDLYLAGGPEALGDRHPKPNRVWNRIPDEVRERIVRLALDEPALSPRQWVYLGGLAELHGSDRNCCRVGPRERRPPDLERRAHDQRVARSLVP
jgi:hypothetical protein